LSKPITRRAVVAGAAALATPSWRDAVATPLVAPQDAALRRALAALPYERVTAPGSAALTEWERLRARGDRWPVIIGDDQALSDIAAGFSNDDPRVFPNAATSPFQGSPNEILQRAAAARWPQVLEHLPSARSEADLQDELGDWPATPPLPAGLTVATDILSGRPLDQVHILLIPTRSSWEVPAYLRWGGSNECPIAEHHVVAFRSWHERYGAEIVGVNGATINARTSRRPAARPEALTLAREQFRYAPDIVEQGLNSISALAALLLQSDWWFFWWD
jgi:hypothetical protein